MKKRMLNCLVAAAVLALALTGCGGGQKSGDAPAASGSAQGGGAGEAKDSLTIALTNEPTTLDPQLAADSIGGMIILNLHDPLCAGIRTAMWCPGWPRPGKCRMTVCPLPSICRRA